MTGAIAFTNDSIFEGSLITTNSDVSLVISDSYAGFVSGNASVLSALDVSGESEMVFEIDPDDTSASMITVDGSAYIGEDVTITPVLTALPDDLTSQILITANQLDFQGDYNDLEISNIPWLYTTDLVVTDGDTDTLGLQFVLKSTDELGLDANEAAAFSTLMQVFASDDDLGAAIAALTTAHDFDEAYDLLIPQRTDASTRYLEAQSNAAFGAMNDVLDLAGTNTGDGTRIWVQEFFVSIDQEAVTDSPGYNGGGFGMSMGADRRWGPIDAIGLMMGFSSGDFEEKTGGNNPVTTTSLGAGGYVQEKLGPVDVRLAAMLSGVKFDAHRDIEFSDTLYYNLDAEWSGWTSAASLSATYKQELGPVYLKPLVSVDWFTLHQQGYSETGGGDLLEATVSESDTDRLTASAVLALGRDWTFGESYLQTEISGGARSVASSTPYEAEVSYAGADGSFMLYAPETDPEAALFGVNVLGGNEWTSFQLGYDLEAGDTSTTHYFGGSLRIRF